MLPRRKAPPQARQRPPWPRPERSPPPPRRALARATAADRQGGLAGDGPRQGVPTETAPGLGWA
eukprot:4452901-Pyramimonas_sp.AAC.1